MWLPFVILQHHLGITIRSKIAKRASDVITQTNSDKQNRIVEDLALFQARKQVFLETIFKTKIWCSFSSYFSRNTLMLSDSHGVPIICILFLDFARFVIGGCRVNGKRTIRTELIVRPSCLPFAQIVH